MTATHARGVPRRQLSIWHAAAVCVGMVIGSGIFRTAPVAAQNIGSAPLLLGAWLVGGAVSLVGALCFAEMAAAFPDAGGDYFFLLKAFGERAGFLFAWSRFAVVHTGSIALLAFVFGDYVGALIPLGPYGSSLFAACIVALLIGINLAGVRVGMHAQVVLLSLVVAGLLAVGAGGVSMVLQGRVPLDATPVVDKAATSHFGVALVFIFLAYGGWSDAATLSSEMRDEARGITRALILGMLGVTVLYLFANWAYLRVLGHSGLAHSVAPAADLMLRAFGPSGQVLMVAAVSITSVTAMNALLIAGARTTYAAARDTPALGRFAGWHAQRGTPPAAIIGVGIVSLALIGVGTATREGFATIVDYLSPVYWGFLTMSGVALFRLRRRYPAAPRPFRVPLYPWLPLLFVTTSAYVLCSSLVYVRIGAVLSVLVLGFGAVLMLVLERRSGVPRQA
jgi:amino acid transporter